MSRQIARAAKVRLRSSKDDKSRNVSVASSMSAFGIVGWSLAVPLVLLIGIVVLFHRDSWGSRNLWLFGAIVIGLVIGIINSIKEVSKEYRKAYGDFVAKGAVVDNELEDIDGI